MNELETVYSILDKSDWDYGQLSQIESLLKENFEKITNEEKEKFRRYFQLEQEVFAFNKGPEKGVSYKISGIRKLQDGSEVPTQWPDINSWNEQDFEYVINRFKNCKNLFAKTEYGLVLFYSEKLKHNKDIQILLDELFLLSKIYLQKAIADKVREKELKVKGKNLLNNFYTIYFRNVLINAFHIANKRKADPKILDFYQQLIRFVTETHNKWELKLSSTMRAIIDLTDFAIEYYNDFIMVIDASEFIRKNWEAAKYLSKSNIWGAIYTTDISIKLCKLLQVNVKDWKTFKAQQYEQLAKDSIGNTQNLAAISFIEKALRLYREIKDSGNIKRLEEWYAQIRGTGNFSAIKDKLSSEVTKEITEGIKEEIRTNTNDGILDIFVMCPMFSSLEIIEEEAKRFKKQFVLLDMMGGSFFDKFGNTIINYQGNTPEWAFIQTYSIHFQLGVQKLIYFFIESFKAGKLNSESIISYLEKGWLNEPIVRNYNRYEMVFKPIEIIKPSIKEFMRELEIWRLQHDYVPQLVTVIDSLVLKIEALMRYFCDRLGIATFKPKQGSVVMEKNLDDILADLAHAPKDRPSQLTNFDENDRQFIKFVMTEKAGHNLRNKVAHGLMDINEYSIEKAILAFAVIMRLSKYKFVAKDNEHHS